MREVSLRSSVNSEKLETTVIWRRQIFRRENRCLKKSLTKVFKIRYKVLTKWQWDRMIMYWNIKLMYASVTWTVKKRQMSQLMSNVKVGIGDGVAERKRREIRIVLNSWK